MVLKVYFIYFEGCVTIREGYFMTLEGYFTTCKGCVMACEGYFTNCEGYFITREGCVITPEGYFTTRGGYLSNSFALFLPEKIMMQYYNRNVAMPAVVTVRGGSKRSPLKGRCGKKKILVADYSEII